MFHPQTALGVAKILTLMGDPPNARSKLAEGDLEGELDVWFDGGAWKEHTGSCIYHFADGTKATTITSPSFSVLIRFPSGRIVEALEKHRDSLHPLALVGLNDDG